MKGRALPWMANIGELLVLIGALMWMFQPGIMLGTREIGAGWVFGAGSVLFAIGRILGAQGDYAQSQNTSQDFRLRRLYRQRMAGTLILLLAALLINIRSGFYFGYFVTRSLWQVPFVAFVIIELYTAFRIPYLEKKILNK